MRKSDRQKSKILIDYIGDYVDTPDELIGCGSTLKIFLEAVERAKARDNRQKEEIKTNVSLPIVKG